jgi:hypothetical protein
MTYLEGTVWDLEPPNQLAGILLKICIEGEYWCETVQTGQDKTKGAGYYSAVLGAEGPREGNWWVALVDAEGKPLSQAVRFETDTGDCEAGGGGHQRVIIDFKRNY